MTKTGTKRVQVTPKGQTALPVGTDIGAGSSKMVVNGTEIRCPSYILYLPNDPYEAEEVETGGFVEYLDGDRADLKGKRWFGGSSAKLYDPHGTVRILDEAKGKITYGLQATLTCLATQPHQDEWYVGIVASIQDTQLYAKELKNALQGHHTVKFNLNSKPSVVHVEVLAIANEGQGAIIHSGSKPNETTVLFDFGSRNLTVSYFGSKGKLINRVLTQLGVSELVHAIANDPEVRKMLDTQVDEDIIREGIENGSLQYGKRGGSFNDAYYRHLEQWASKAIGTAVKLAGDRMKTADNLLATGGGTQLVGFDKFLVNRSIRPLQNGALANAKGLQSLAETIVNRRAA
ncbi:MAG: ParM/StbA family protein [Elainellaceae cyanobacterium]